LCTYKMYLYLQVRLQQVLESVLTMPCGQLTNVLYNSSLLKLTSEPKAATI
jgi:hypothetical protein